MVSEQLNAFLIVRRNLSGVKISARQPARELSQGCASSGAPAPNLAIVPHLRSRGPTSRHPSAREGLHSQHWTSGWFKAGGRTMTWYQAGVKPYRCNGKGHFLRLSRLRTCVHACDSWYIFTSSSGPIPRSTLLRQRWPIARICLSNVLVRQPAI